ncbi:MAG: helix-turn-helix domain-containing protein [Actinomycetota bacterium]
MFPTTDEVTRALRAYARSFGPRSRSVMSTNGNGHDFQDDPFGRGFIENLDARTTLLSRFSVLDERERATLALWYIEDLAVPAICDALGCSRATLYRIRDAALAKLTDAAVQAEAVVSTH